MLLGEAETPTIAVSYDLKERSTKLFKSYEDFYVESWKVAAATSAAPTYFPAIQINDRWFVDGSLSTNNPVLIAYSEAKKLWPYENIKILSIGTGYDSKSYEGEKVKNWGIFSWLKGRKSERTNEFKSGHSEEYAVYWLIVNFGAHRLIKLNDYHDTFYIVDFGVL